MIPRPYIAEWQTHAPWKQFNQIEQDLVISRALVEIFSDDFLKEHLAFRGGTALHKLYLSPAPRYSEDIDLVQIIPGPIKPIMQRLHEVITFFDEPRKTKVGGHGAKALYRFTSEYEEIRLRLKLEINCKEHFNVLDWVHFPFQVDSNWFSGTAEITTYNINELLGTKLRALYQRSKGRDLFDLDYARLNLDIDTAKIIHCFKEYISFATDKKPPSKKEFLLNIELKEIDPDFTGDMEALLRPEITYNQDAAFEPKCFRKMKRFAKHVSKIIQLGRGALPSAEVRNILLATYFLGEYFDHNRISSIEEELNSKFDRFRNPVSFEDNSSFTRNFEELFKEIEKCEPRFEGVFNDLNIANVISKDPDTVQHLCLDLLHVGLYDSTSYRKGFHELIDLFSNLEGRMNQTCQTPSSLSNLFREIFNNARTVIDLTCGTGGLLDAFVEDGSSIYGQDLIKEDIALARLRFAFEFNVNLKSCDSLHEHKDNNVNPDVVLTIPPFKATFSPDILKQTDFIRFGMPSPNNANMLWLQLALYHTNNHSKAAILLPTSALSSGGRDMKIRKTIIEEGHVDAIITIPSRLYAPY